MTDRSKTLEVMARAMCAKAHLPADDIMSDGKPFWSVYAGMLEYALQAERMAVVPVGDRERLLAVVTAAQEWAGNCEGVPDNPNDADLLKAIHTFDGDRTEPCEGCDGECGEPCAPYTVAGAHRALDAFSEEWRRKRGVVVIPASPYGKAVVKEKDDE